MMWQITSTARSILPVLIASCEQRRDHAWEEYCTLFPRYKKAADAYNACYERLQKMSVSQLLAEVRQRPVGPCFQLKLEDGSRVLTWAILRHEYKRLRIASLSKQLGRLSRRIARYENWYNLATLALVRASD